MNDGGGALECLRVRGQRANPLLVQKPMVQIQVISSLFTYLSFSSLFKFLTIYYSLCLTFLINFLLFNFPHEFFVVF